jgi:hypothetical protein
MMALLRGNANIFPHLHGLPLGLGLGYNNYSIRHGKGRELYFILYLLFKDMSLLIYLDPLVFYGHPLLLGWSALGVWAGAPW